MPHSIKLFNKVIQEQISRVYARLYKNSAINKYKSIVFNYSRKVTFIYLNEDICFIFHLFYITCLFFFCWFFIKFFCLLLYIILGRPPVWIALEKVLEYIFCI